MITSRAPLCSASAASRRPDARRGTSRWPGAASPACANSLDCRKTFSAAAGRMRSVACLSRPWQRGQGGTSFGSRNCRTSGSTAKRASQSRQRNLAGGAVKLEDRLAAGELVQAVDILRDHAAQHARFSQAAEDSMTGVRLGGGEVAAWASHFCRQYSCRAGRCAKKSSK